MKHAIDALRAAPPPGPAAVEAFLSAHSFPLVEGTSVTFVWKGLADEVLLRHWVWGLPESQPLERVAGTDLWALRMEIPALSRIEYKFEIRRGGRRQLVCDPRNDRAASDPYGANSVVHGKGYRVPDWAERDPDARRGSLREHVLASRELGERRPVRVYLPARFRKTRRYPLLVVHDGSDFLRYSSLQVVLDNLIHRLEIPPMVAALLDSPARLREYADDPRHAGFLARELVPQLEAIYPLVARPEARGLLGASFGAVAALAAAWRHPGVFDRLMLLSGSFAFTDIGTHDRGPVFDPVVRFMNAFRERPGTSGGKVFLSCGIYEPMIYFNRSLVPRLQAAGFEVRFREVRDGHNWENWRDRMREGLSWLFPGPLWMVYE